MKWTVFQPQKLAYSPEKKNQIINQYIGFRNQAELITYPSKNKPW